MGAIPVPAISVCFTCAATFSTFVDIPASHPGYMASESCVTWTGETSGIVGTSGLNTTVGGSIEICIINLTLIQFSAGWLDHISVTIMSINTVFIIFTSNNIISTSVVVFVANPVAAIVIRTKPKPVRVVRILCSWEILGVETHIIATLCPARVYTVRVILTVTLSLSAGMF